MQLADGSIRLFEIIIEQVGTIKMLKVALSLTIGLLATTPVYGENHNGDATKGEAAFKKCKACHGIIADNGNGDVIIKGGKTGPNLWGVIGRQAGTYPEYKYGKSIVAAGNAGFLWDENGFLAYIKDPQKFWKEKLDDTKAKSKMAFKMKKGSEDILAYILSVGPPPEFKNEATSTSN